MTCREKNQEVTTLWLSKSTRDEAIVEPRRRWMNNEKIGADHAPRPFI